MILLLTWLAGCARAEPIDATCHLVTGDPVPAAADGPEAARLSGALVPVLADCGQITEIRFLPGSDSHVAVAAKGGRLWAADLAAGTVRLALVLPVTTKVEMGLLGIAFHPDFASNGRLWLSYNPTGEKLQSRIEEWHWEGAFPAGEPKPVRTLFTVAQPWANHNGGQIAFGPDGALYAAFGDGGSAGDPKNAAQDPRNYLGKIVRLGVDGAPAEIWASGLRNPWKFTFAPDGRMVAGDVGQNRWEEVTFVVPGGNHGWKIREGNACYEPATGCREDGLVAPIWTYGHDLGVSVTGGVVGTHAELGPLAGRYLFADYGTGRMWALALPATGTAAEPSWVGRFPGGISTFGADASGRVYVGNLNRGDVARLVAP